MEARAAWVGRHRFSACCVTFLHRVTHFPTSVGVWGKLGGRVSAAIETLCSPVVGEFVEASIRQQSGIALAWLRRFHQQHQQDLVRHLFLVDRLLDGLVLEVDASTTCGGAACWIGARRLAQQRPPDALVRNFWALGEGIPPTRPLWKRSWCYWPFGTVFLRVFEEGLCWSVWFGMVKFFVRAVKINETATELQCIWHLWAMSLWGCTFGAKPTRLRMC